MRGMQDGMFAELGDGDDEGEKCLCFFGSKAWRYHFKMLVN